ncbi:hypothetical protein N7490_007471 [Penicillium lividum]|nr:hypothetical protein N7490_007471 [Penicillium lividum]
MTDPTPASLVALLSKPPSTSTSPPEVPSGTVSLFVDDNWSSTRLDLDIDDYAPSQRHTFKSSMLDAATWVAFNLPIGTVMTLMDNYQSGSAGQSVADLSDCGRCVDLVGTGNTESLDLLAMRMNDIVSCFFWRTVDLNMGAVEMFEDVGFSGGRTTIFLSEWSPGTIVNVEKWWLQDSISSVRWKTLDDRQEFTLYDNFDGTGNRYSNIKGWGRTKEISDLGDDASFNDEMSSFSWVGVNPVKEIIAPFNIVISSTSSSSGLVSSISGTNNSTIPQPVTVTLTNTDAQTLTITTSDQQVQSITSTQTMSEKAGVPGVDEVTATWAIALAYSYTTTDTKSTTDTTTIALAISETVNAPPETSYTATLLVSIGRIPPTVYTTTAQRWYAVPVTGGVEDPTNNNYYLRVEPVSVSVSGSLASNTTVNIESTPLTSS